MRLTGVLLVFLGIIMLTVGAFSGCSSLFTWNGRHPIAEVSLPNDGEITHTFTPFPGRRYSLSVEVVFDREGLSKGPDGVTIVEAKMPLVVRAKDSAGTSLAEVVGWLDPNEPPNVLYGQAAHESMRGPTAELSVVRLVAPFSAASASPITVSVTLGADRVGQAGVTARRLVIHDDAVPGGIRNAFIASGVGAVAFLAGVVVLVVAWFRRPRASRRARREGSPATKPA